MGRREAERARRKLGVKKETVRKLEVPSLGDPELTQVAGGGYKVSLPCRTMPTC